MQEGTPEYTSFIANQAFARAKASDEVVYGNSPFKQGQPGSSMDNPVDATSLSGPPPRGTWIKKPNGAVVQVP